MPRCACAKRGIRQCVCVSVCLCRVLYICSMINEVQVRVSSHVFLDLIRGFALRSRAMASQFAYFEGL